MKCCSNGVAGDPAEAAAGGEKRLPVAAGRATVKRIDTTATLASLAALLCWAFGPVFLKYLTSYIDSWTQNALRYTTAVAFWLPFLLYSMHRGTLDRRTWRLALGPTLPNIIMQSLWAAAFYYIGAGFATLLSNTSVLWVTAFSMMLFPQERGLLKSRYFWVGLAMSLTGVAGVLVFKENFAATKTVVGIIMALVMALMWGVYTISVRLFLHEIDSRISFGVLCIYTTLGLWAGTFVFGKPGSCLTMGIGPWAAVVISSITAIALGHAFYYAAIKRIGATIPMLVMLAQPFIVCASSRLVFGETLTGLQIVFGLVLLAGCACAILAQQDLKNDALP